MTPEVWSAHRRVPCSVWRADRFRPVRSSPDLQAASLWAVSGGPGPVTVATGIPLDRVRPLRLGPAPVRCAALPQASSTEYPEVRRGPPTQCAGSRPGDRKSVVSGKSVSVRVDLGGGRIIKKK